MLGVFVPSVDILMLFTDLLGFTHVFCSSLCPSLEGFYDTRLVSYEGKELIKSHTFAKGHWKGTE